MSGRGPVGAHAREHARVEAATVDKGRGSGPQQRTYLFERPLSARARVARFDMAAHVECLLGTQFAVQRSAQAFRGIGAVHIVIPFKRLASDSPSAARALWSRERTVPTGTPSATAICW